MSERSSPAAISPSAVTLSRRRSFVQAAKERFLFKKELNEQQVDVLTTARVRNRTRRVLIFALFIDIGGAVLLQGGYPTMCANAPGAADMGKEVPGAFPASNFEFATGATGPPALDYAMSINLIVVSNMLGKFFADYIAGTASDRLGRKVVIQGCLLGGVFSYILMFIAGVWARSYWFFLASLFVNGLAGGSRPVVGAYLQDIHEPLEYQTKVLPQVIMVALFGMMGGSILGMFWSSVSNAIPGNENSLISLFGPVWLGVVLSIASLLMVYFYCPEPAKKENAATPDGKPAARQPVSTTQKRVMAIILIAGSLDTFGDQGNNFARNTILTNRYPAGRVAVVNYLLLSSNILCVFGAQMIVIKTSKKLGVRGFGLWAILGNLASSAVQFTLLLIVWYDDDKRAIGAFIVSMFMSTLFGVCSTLSAMMLWPRFIPPHRRGQLSGLRGSLTALANCGASIMLSFLYQTGSMAEPASAPNDTTAHDAGAGSGEVVNGTSAGIEYEVPPLDRAAMICLSVCGSISFLALVCYLPLPGLLPPPAVAPPSIKKEKSNDGVALALPDPEMSHPLEYYDSMPFAEWTKLPIALRHKIQTELRAKGLPQKIFPWGSWSADQPTAKDFLTGARAEFADLHNFTTAFITSEAEMEKVLDAHKKRPLMEEEPAEKERLATARREMGEWICDYLDDAGYEGLWRDRAYLLKAIIMTAMPPLDPLDGKRAAFDNVEELRTFVINWLRVLDLHINNAAVTGSTDLTDHRVSLSEISHLSR